MTRFTPTPLRRFARDDKGSVITETVIIFPLLIVVIAAKIGPIDAMILAAARPEEYAEIMHDAHLPIAAFGGIAAFGTWGALMGPLIVRLAMEGHAIAKGVPPRDQQPHT
jgi:ABC-type molybdate transport system permease subunit